MFLLCMWRFCSFLTQDESRSGKKKQKTKTNHYFLVVPSLFPRSTVHKRARPPLFFLSICLHCFPGHIFSMRFCTVFIVDVSPHTVSSNNSPTFFIWTNNKTSYITPTSCLFPLCHRCGWYGSSCQWYERMRSAFIVNEAWMLIS